MNDKEITLRNFRLIYDRYRVFDVYVGENRIGYIRENWDGCLMVCLSNYGGYTWTVLTSRIEDAYGSVLIEEALE